MAKAALLHWVELDTWGGHDQPPTALCLNYPLKMVSPSAANKPGPSERHNHGFSGHVRGHWAMTALHQRSEYHTHHAMETLGRESTSDRITACLRRVCFSAEVEYGDGFVETLTKVTRLPCSDFKQWCEPKLCQLNEPYLNQTKLRYCVQ